MMQSRYSRQILFPHIGESGQKKLGESKVLIVGMGALGTVLANHMVRAGVGFVRFVDRDFVEASNLQRQMLFDEEDVKERLPKAVAAERKLRKINSSVQIEGIVGDVTALTIAKYAENVDLILDGTDNFQTRFLINDYCFKHNIPFFYGGAVSTRGMQATFIPHETPCLRCLFEDAGGTSETCDTVGVLGSIIDVIASLQALEAIKWMTGNKAAIRKSMLSIDLWHTHQHFIKWGKPKHACITCQLDRYPALAVQEEDQFSTLCGRDTIQITPRHVEKRDLVEWEKRLEKAGKVERNPFLLRFQTDPYTMVLFSDGRVLVQGTEELATAKSLYAKYIGM
ncbi:ThiF family adenylyltransferase [Bacillus horti]|uniref:Adenylyltransferase/sulfurtransferase n=1 Tax=Caldalkalibacillus horti TaxID=77523 RepID=A0ABT9W3G4_9BACI|nr:ThiF family adenylyltransferase [Bacillus horti]MDQ0167776.1 adenylyltransferase/sulfurtransferase [Bacillus horti]